MRASSRRALWQPCEKVRRASRHVSGIWSSPTVRTPVAPHQHSCQSWPIGTQRKWASNVNKHRNSARAKKSPKSMATAKRWNTRNLLSSRFHRQVVEGTRWTGEWLSGRETLLMHAYALGIEETRYFTSFVSSLEHRVSFLWKFLNWRCPGQLNKLFLSPAIKTDYKNEFGTEFVFCIRC